MSLNQFKIINKDHEFSVKSYDSLAYELGEPSLIDDQNTFAYWHRPEGVLFKYQSVTLDCNGVHCSVTAKYNYEQADLLIKHTKKAWFEPGRSLLTVTGKNLDECNYIMKMIVMLIEKYIRPEEFSIMLTGYKSKKDFEFKKDDDDQNYEDLQTPGKPVVHSVSSTNANGSSSAKVSSNKSGKKQSPLKMLSVKK